MDYQVERYALSLEWEKLPTRIQNRAVMCGIDLMTALLLGCKSKQFGYGVNLARTLGLRGDVPLLGSNELRFNVLGSTIAMAHGSNAFDIDDGFNLIKGHPGTSFVAGAMASCLESDASYTQYLTTLVACYELTIRWALAMQDHYGYLHSTGAYGSFGTALAVGRQRGLSESELNNALSIADFHAPMVPVMRSVEVPSMNKDGVPFGALVGAMAVLETQEGVTGKGHLLEMPEYQPLLQTLGDRFYMEELYFKPFTCCRWAHQPITACLQLLNDHNLSAADISRVSVHTFSAAARLYKSAPQDTDEAQYNIAFPIACALIHGDVGYDQVRDEAVFDEDVLSMMDRMEFIVDEELEAQFPEKRLAWVELVDGRGRSLKSKVYEAPGEASDPHLGISWVKDKFVKRTASIMKKGSQELALEYLEKPGESLRDVVCSINDMIR